MIHTNKANVHNYRNGRRFDLGEFRTRFRYFEYVVTDDSVNRSTSRGSGHSPNAAAFTGKVISAIKASSTGSLSPIAKRGGYLYKPLVTFPGSMKRV